MKKISTVDIKETSEGDLYFNLPDDVIERLDWKEGDELIWDHDPANNQAMIRKVKYESFSLDLDDETFNGVAKLAHDNDVTFNKQIELMLQDFIEQCEADPQHIKRVVADSDKVAD